MTVRADMGFNKQDAVTLGAKVELSKIRAALNMQMRYYLADRGHFDKPRTHTHTLISRVIHIKTHIDW